MSESQLDRLIAELEAEGPLRTGGEREVVTRSGPSERMRSVAQGITFGSADEAEAYIRSQFMGEDYDTALADVRGRLKAYRDDKGGEALMFEAGGAALPAIAGAIMTGGSTLAAQYPMLARVGGILGLGAAEGGTYAFNTGEGGFQNRMNRVPGGMVAGAAGAGVGAGVGAATGATLRTLTDTARRKLGSRAASVVEREIRKAVEDGNMSIQEAVDGVMNGRILADNRTVASVARAWRAQSAEAADILAKGVNNRPQVKRAELMQFLGDKMDAPGNARANFAMSADDLKANTSADYNRIFAANSGPLGDETTETLIDAYRRVPAAKRDLDKLVRAQTGQTPFFRETDEGVEFLRAPNLKEAEIMRRAINTAATREYTTGGGPVGDAYMDVERGVRSQIDEISPELAQTRAKWSNIETQNDFFLLGQKGLENADKTAMNLAKAQEAGPEAVAAFRAGLTDAMRARSTTGARQTMVRNINSPETKEGQVMEMAFPEDDLPQLRQLAQNADDAQHAFGQLTQGAGSDTAITQGRLAEQGVGALETILDASSGSPTALLRLAGQAVKSTNPGLTPKQAAEAARLVVETDPNVVARALTDRSAMDALYNLVNRITSKSTNAGQLTGGAVGGLLGSMGMQP